MGNRYPLSSTMKKKYIVYLGYTSFPIGLAEVQKIILISKSLIISGNRVTVISRNGSLNKSQQPGLKASGEFQGIQYIYASGSCFRNDNFFKRRLNELKGKVNETLLLWKMKRKGQLDFAILSTRKFSSVLYYFFLSKLLRFKTVLNYVEYYTAFHKRKSQFRQRVNDKLFDKYAPRIVDSNFLISEYLNEHVLKIAPEKKILKIPGLTDFDKFNSVEKKHSEPYFLFCGDATYKEIVFFIIDSYAMIKTTTPYYLYIVVSGRQNDIDQVKQYTEKQNKTDAVKIFSRLSEIELYTLYKNAKALLIPLRPTIQDAARFPHKTGEYLASGNPVISTNYGEMKFYFKDKENILLADSYEIKLFAKQMQFVIDNPEESKVIGVRGREKAAELFEYKRQSPRINSFLESMV